MQGEGAIIRQRTGESFPGASTLVMVNDRALLHAPLVEPLDIPIYAKDDTVALL